MTTSKLLEPFKLGPLTLPNRLVMAPLTRNRATPPGMVPARSRRILRPARLRRPPRSPKPPRCRSRAMGYQDTPGIYSKEQVAGWRKVTERVHAQWRTHLHPDLACRPHFAYALQPGGGKPVAPRRSAPRARPSSTTSSPTFRAPRAGAVRNPRDHRRLQARCRERAGGRLRRRRDPRRQRLSARPVRQGRRQPAHRCLWRLDREPRQLMLEVSSAVVADRRRAHRHPHLPGDAGQRHLRLQPAAAVRSHRRRPGALKLAYIHVVEGATGARATSRRSTMRACATASRAPTSPTTATTSRWRRRCWRPSPSTWSRSASLHLQSRPGRAADARRTDREWDRATFYGGTERDTPTIRRWMPNRRRSR